MRRLSAVVPCLLRARLVAAPLLILAGCVSPETRARRLAAEMLDPGTPLRAALDCRARLRAMGPAAHPHLAEAFFPIGLYDVPESGLSDAAAAGFNLIVNGDNEPRYLDRARAAGLRVIPYIRLDRMAEDVRRMKGVRAVSAWYLFDEPDLRKMPPAEYHRLSAQLRRLDPERAIYLTVLSPERYADYVGAADILAPNPYPIVNLEAARNELRWVGAALDEARAVAGERPVWAVIQAFWAAPWWPRNPTPAELRAMVFLALNHGADGIVYFSWKSGDRTLPEHTDLFAAIREVNGQLTALRGALLVPPEKGAVRVLGGDPEEGAREADASLRRFGGAALLIVVNPDPEPKAAELVLDGLSGEATVSELFARPAQRDARLPPSAPLSLWLEPFDARVFWITPLAAPRQGR